MKKGLLAKIFLLLFLEGTISISLAAFATRFPAYMRGFSIGASSPEHVVINEFDQDPFGWDYDGIEWVELFNPKDNDVDISGWKLSTTHDTTVSVTISEGTKIASKEFWVYTHETQWLDNEYESIILQDVEGNEIDRTPKVSDTENDKRCWARYPNGIDTDSDTDWKFVSKYSSTKGYNNTIIVIESGDKKDLRVGEKRKFHTNFEVGKFVYHYDYKVIECPEFISYSAYFVERFWDPNKFRKLADYIHSTVDVVPSAKLGIYDLRVKWAWSSSPTPPSEWKYVYELHLKVNLAAPTSKFDVDVSLSVDEEVVSPGSSVGLRGKASVRDREGKIYPLSSFDLTLVYEKADGTTFNQSITTGTEGEFSYYGVYDMGMWKVKTIWEGDSARKEAESSWVSFEVADRTPPVANAGPDQTVAEDTLVTFDGSGSSDNMNISSYTWNFMDATPQTLTGLNPTYTFSTPGIYTITLKVTDAAGNYATDTFTITILDMIAPLAVTLKRPTNITHESLRLDWEENKDSDFSRYEIYQSIISGTLGTPIHNVTDGATTHYIVTGLSEGTTYYFIVRVFDIGGLYAGSNQVKVKTKAVVLLSRPEVVLLSRPEVLVGIGGGVAGLLSIVGLIVKSWKTGKGVLEILIDLRKFLRGGKKKKEKEEREPAS